MTDANNNNRSRVSMIVIFQHRTAVINTRADINIDDIEILIGLNLGDWYIAQMSYTMILP